MNTLQTLQERIDEEIGNFLKQDIGNPPELYDPITYTLKLGGKRMRPLMVLLGCDLFHGNIEDAIGPAIGVEIFHNFTLLHDDIMDNAPLRRNHPTVHQKWNSNIAILSGDVMFVKSCQQLLKAPKKAQEPIFNLFFKTAVEVCEGQQLDMNYEKEDVVSISQYIEMISLKTAVLLAASLKMGALIAGATEKEATLLYEFGKNIGISFQLQDDLLDVYGSSDKFGKTVGGDIVSNKKTFLLLKAFELACYEEKKVLDQWIGGKLKGNNLEKVKAVTAIYDSLGIKKESQEKMHHYFEKGVNSLKDIVSVGEGKKTQLLKFSEGLMQRET